MMEPSFYTLPSGRSYGKSFIEMCIKRDANWLTESDSDYPYNETPVHYACRTSQKEATLFFLSKLNDSYLKNPQTNDNGQNIVHLTCEWGDIEVISETMGNFASSYKAVNSVDKNGMTPLAILVKKANKIGIAIFQLARKVPMPPLNLTNPSDPFVIAQASNDPIILRLLLGSKPINIGQCTKLQRAAIENETILFKAYFNESEPIENRCIAAIKLNDTDLLRLLWSKINNETPTPKMIQAAKECSDSAMIAVLIELDLLMDVTPQGSFSQIVADFEKLHSEEDELKKCCEEEQTDACLSGDFNFESLKDDFEKLSAKEDLKKYEQRKSLPSTIYLKTSSTNKSESAESAVEDYDISSYTDEYTALEDEKTKFEEPTELEPRASSCAVAADEDEESLTSGHADNDVQDDYIKMDDWDFDSITDEHKEAESFKEEDGDIESLNEFDKLNREGVSSPLHISAKEGDLEKVKELLLRKVCRVNQCDEFGNTALFCLCQSESILKKNTEDFGKVLELFKYYYVNINAQNWHGETAFRIFFKMLWNKFIRQYDGRWKRNTKDFPWGDSEKKKSCKRDWKLNWEKKFEIFASYFIQLGFDAKDVIKYMEETKWTEEIEWYSAGGLHTVKGPTYKRGATVYQSESTYYIPGTSGISKASCSIKKLIPDSYKWLEKSLNPNANTSTSGCTIA